MSESQNQIINEVPKEWEEPDWDELNDKEIIENFRKGIIGLNVLEELSESEDDWFRRAVALSPNTPQEILEKLRQDEDEDVKAAANEERELPDDWRYLEDIEKALKIFHDKDINSDVLEILDKKGHRLITNAKSLKQKLPREWQLSNANDLCKKLKAEKQVSQEILETLSNFQLYDYCSDKINKVQWEIAIHPSTTEELLIKLHKKNRYFDRAMKYEEELYLQERNLPEDWRGLEDEIKVRKILEEDSINEEVLENLTFHKRSVEIRKAVAKKNNTPHYILNNLRVDEDWEVRNALIERDIAEEFKFDQFKTSDLVAIAENPSTNIEFLDRIIDEYPNEIIVNNARLNINEIRCPESIKSFWLPEDRSGLHDQKPIKHYLNFKCDNPKEINAGEENLLIDKTHNFESFYSNFGAYEAIFNILISIGVSENKPTIKLLLRSLDEDGELVQGEESTEWLSLIGPNYEPKEWKLAKSMEDDEGEFELNTWDLSPKGLEECLDDWGVDINEKIELWKFAKSLLSYLPPSIQPKLASSNGGGGFIFNTFESNILTSGNIDNGGRLTKKYKNQSFSKICSSEGAFLAITDQKNLFAWGSVYQGAIIPPEIANYKEHIIDIVSTSDQFCALTEKGGVYCWGDYGKDTLKDTSAGQYLTKDIIKLFSNGSAFAAIKNDGSLICWGSESDGGMFGIEGAEESNIKAADGNAFKNIVSTYGAFAALREDGSVYTWGSRSAGADPEESKNHLKKNIISIISSKGAFAALSNEGEVITWGDDYWGGDSTNVAESIKANVKEILSSNNAFVALKEDGSVVSWGNPGRLSIFERSDPEAFGWDIDGEDMSNSTNLINKKAKEIFAYRNGFAALLKDKKLVFWGDKYLTDLYKEISDKLPSDIEAVFPDAFVIVGGICRRFAFVAMRSNKECVGIGFSDPIPDSVS